MTIAEKLKKIFDIKGAIKEALFFVGQEVADKFEDYAQAIREVCNVPFENLGYSEEDAAKYRNLIKMAYLNGKYAKQYIENNPNEPAINPAKLGALNPKFFPYTNNSIWINSITENTGFQRSSFSFPKLTFLQEDMTRMFLQSITPIIDIKTPNLKIAKLMFSNIVGTLVIKFNAEKVTDFTDCFKYTVQNNPILKEMTITGIGTQEECTALTLNAFSQWGKANSDFPNARNSLIDTLLNLSYDRAAAGYSVFTLTLRQDTFNILTEEEITAITNKGYTITIG